MTLQPQNTHQILFQAKTLFQRGNISFSPQKHQTKSILPQKKQSWKEKFQKFFKKYSKFNQKKKQTRKEKCQKTGRRSPSSQKKTKKTSPDRIPISFSLPNR